MNPEAPLACGSIATQMTSTELRADLLRKIRQHLPELRDLGVRHLSLFGSVARGEATLDSDIDVLVDFGAPPTFDQYMDVKIALEDLLGRRVDLVTVTGLRDEVRPYVEREALSVA